MRIIFLVPILMLSACATPNGTLYPTEAEMNRSCDQVVAGSYKSLEEYNNRAALSTGVTIGGAGGSCAVITGGICLAVGALVYALDIAFDLFGKGAASSEFSKNIQQGRDMKCTEN